jgi:thioredoxin 1
MKNLVAAAIGIVIAVVAGYAVFDIYSGSNTDMMQKDTMMKSESSMMTRPEDSMMKKDDGAMMKSEGAMMKEDSMMKSESSAMGNQPVARATYAAYAEGVIGNGSTSLLFFHAPWCPNCRTADKDLVSIYADGTASISTYKVDYDTAAALKSRYGVTYQHTFVLIDGEGNALKTVSGPTASALAALVK